MEEINMKRFSLIMAILIVTLSVAVPTFATGNTSVFSDGEIIYCETFNGVPDTDDLAVIESTLGYRVVKVNTDEDTLGYRITEKNISDTIIYSIKDGKLCIDNSAEGGAYSYLFIYDSDIMKELIKTTYTIQYEITYLAGTQNYCNPIFNWDGEFSFQTPMLRGNGTYRNQVRYTDRESKTNKWYDWDGMGGTWLESMVTENATALLQNVVVRLVSVPDKGVYIYANEYLISEPNEIATAPASCLPGNLPYSAVGLRLQRGASVTVDNFAIYAGDGSKITPDFTAYGFKGLAPVELTTEAPETSKAPVVTTEGPKVTTAPETTAEPTEATSAPAPVDSADVTTAPTSQEKKGCGSSVSAGFIVIAAMIPAAVFFRKRK